MFSKLIVLLFVCVRLCLCGYAHVNEEPVGARRGRQISLVLELLASRPKCVCRELSSGPLKEQSRGHVSNLSLIYSLIIYITFFLLHNSLQVILFKYFGLSPDLGKHPAGKQNPREVS